MSELEAFLKILKSIAGLVSTIWAIGGWELMAILGQWLAFRISQWIKKTFKRLRGKKPHWLIMQAVTFVLAFLCSFISLLVKYPDQLLAITVVCFFLACFNGAIIQWIFRKSASSPDLHAILSKDVHYVDYPVTTLDRTIAFATGVSLKKGNRKPESDDDSPVTERRDRGHNETKS